MNSAEQSVTELYKNCPFQIEGEESVFEGKWIGARSVKFLDPKTNTYGVWECAYRKTKPEGTEVDGVDIVAILTKNQRKDKYFILVKQYRIPVRGWSLEFPAGLMESESVEDAAIREMKEETGFSVSKILMKATKGELMLDPGLSNDSVSFVTVEVDGDAPENANPQQDLQHGEHIEVVLIPCDEILDNLKHFLEQGVYVEAMLYSFAIGYNLKGML